MSRLLVLTHWTQQQKLLPEGHPWLLSHLLLDATLLFLLGVAMISQPKLEELKKLPELPWKEPPAVPPTAVLQETVSYGASNSLQGDQVGYRVSVQNHIKLFSATMK